MVFEDKKLSPFAGIYMGLKLRGKPAPVGRGVTGDGVIYTVGNKRY